jgi:malate dehydrogenase (oxaloacetate-decarboxylating)
MVSSMANDPIIFAMANPDPEILPDIALSAGAKIVGTGRSDYPNQINNVLVFPGLMKGVLKAKLRNITDDIKVTTAKAIANLVPDNALSTKHILPNIFDKNVVKAIETSIYKTEKKAKQ